MAALQQSLDGLLATGMAAEADKSRLEDLMLTLQTLAFHTPLCHQVSPTPILFCKCFASFVHFLA